MEFKKRLYVMTDEKGEPVAAETFTGLPTHLLEHGAEIGVYGYLRTKRVEVTRRLVSTNPNEPDEQDEGGSPGEPLQNLLDGVNAAAAEGL